VFNNETKTIVFTKKSKKTKFFEKFDNITIYQYKVSDIPFLNKDKICFIDSALSIFS